ncbi:hypothetical protein GRI89_06840 [Altererythrobacter salegens]|uniref:Uncharacterized protein n=1 Tax=Croceibacterium salegens TaxID=1737568 RepID=A0A6I4STD7_9SPHN|nr:hypothetical protein [Croceibacterium salegens]MXO59254.1 hypothetical protein [Croceibacterium salegens]
MAVGLPAEAQEPSATVQTMKGATSCTLSARKEGVDTSRFEKDSSWQRDPDGSYAAINLPVRVTFPADADGISRICVVEATLASQKEQNEMRTALEVLLKQKPLEQKDSVIWMFGGGKNARGLQFFPDNTSKQPQIRFVGAAF